MRGANLADARLGRPEPGNQLKTPKQIDLAGALLISANLRRADLHEVNLSFAHFKWREISRTQTLREPNAPAPRSVGPTWHKLIWRKTAYLYGTALIVGTWALYLNEDWGMREIRDKAVFRNWVSTSTSLPRRTPTTGAPCGAAAATPPRVLRGHHNPP